MIRVALMAESQVQGVESHPATGAPISQCTWSTPATSSFYSLATATPTAPPTADPPPPAPRSPEAGWPRLGCAPQITPYLLDTVEELEDEPRDGRRDRGRRREGLPRAGPLQARGGRGVIRRARHGRGPPDFGGLVVVVGASTCAAMVSQSGVPAFWNPTKIAACESTHISEREIFRSPYKRCTADF
jgi:hypothetical protein